MSSEPIRGSISRHIRQNVYGLVAIFIALGGTAYATHPGGADTISSADIIDREVATPDLASQAVSSGKIAAQAVSSGKLADDAVRTPKIRDLAVTPEKLQSLAVKTSKIGGQAVATSKLADGAVTNAKIASSAVETLSVENRSLRGIDIAEDTVTGKNLDFASILETGFVSTDDDVVVGEFDGSAPVEAEVMRVGDTENGGSGHMIDMASTAGPTRILQVTAIATFRGAPDNHSEPVCQLEGQPLGSLDFEAISQPARTYVPETGAGLAGGQATVTAVGGFVDEPRVTDVRLMCRVIQPGTGVEGDGTFTGGNMVVTAFAT